MRKHKIGDTVIIKKDLNHNKSYGSPGVSIRMERFIGKTAKIIKLELYNSNEYKLDIDGGEFFWTDAMLEEGFTPADLKPCYMVEQRDGVLRMVIDTEKGLTIISKDEFHSSLSDYNDDFTYINPNSNVCDIIKVYGLSKYCYSSLQFNTEVRDLLWERKEEPKITELTLQDVADKMGIPVSQLRIKE